MSASYFLWDVPDIEFCITDGERAYLTVSDADGRIYAEYLYPVDGLVSLHEVPSLLLDSTERLLRAVFTVIIREMQGLTVIAEETLSFTAIYANVETGVTPGEFESGYFLSTFMGVRRTCIGRLEYLHYLGTDTASVECHYSDGTQRSFAAEVTTGSSTYTQIDVSPHRYGLAGRKLVWYTVTAGERTQEYRIDDWHADAAPILLFRNSFGVDELAYCTGKHQVAPEYTRSSSTACGMFRHYDIEEKRWFNADTGVLTSAEAAWFDDVFRSKEVYVCNFIRSYVVRGKEISITESNSENDNADTSMPRFTFKYRYAQRMQNVLQLNRTGRIFDNTFDSTFN